MNGEPVQWTNSPQDVLLHQIIHLIRKQDYKSAEKAITELERFDLSGYDKSFLKAFYQGFLCQQQEALPEAVKHYQEAVRLKPEYATAWNNLGNVFKGIGQLQDAERAYQAAIRLQPDHPNAYHNLGNLYCLLTDTEQAKAAYTQALQVDPSFIAARRQLVELLTREEQPAAAQEHLQAIIKQDPKDALSEYRLALIYHQLGCYSDAKDHYLAAQKKGFDTAELYNYLGVIHLVLGEKAAVIIEYFNEALARDPNEASIYSNLGCAYRHFQRHKEAIKTYDKAIALDPEVGINYYNLGLIYHDKEDYPQAIQYYQTCLKYEPDYSLALAMLVNAHQHIADWSSIESLLPRLVQITKNEIQTGVGTGLSPFGAQLLPIELSLQSDVAKKASQALEKQVTRYPAYAHQVHENKRLKVGYLSSDFVGRHPMGLLMEHFFQYHDSTHFEIFGYALRDPNDAIGQRIKDSFEHFRVLNDASVRDASDHIYKDKIDILVDLAGHTKRAKPIIMAMRPAPIQCFYMGHFGTIGATFIDYQITHRDIVPQSYESEFTEKLVLMPDTHFACQGFEIPKSHLNRKRFALPEDAFIFCAFNTAQRIDRPLFTAWMSILKQAPNAALWLQNENATLTSNLKSAAQEQGVDPDRLYFSKREHITDSWRMLVADCYLDTFSMAGGTSGILTAWGGLPTLSLRGDRPHGRVGCEYLRLMAVPELIAETKDEYIDKAVYYATHPSDYHSLQTKLKAHRDKSFLFKPDSFMRHLEKAYQVMWSRYSKGLTPENILLTR